MKTFEDRLSHLLHTVADEVAPSASLDDRVWARLVEPRPASRRPLMIASAAALALVVAAVVVAEPWGGHSVPVRTLGGDLTSAAPDTWTPLPQAPVPSRDQFLEVWTGTSMLAYGGYSTGARGEDDRADGASFDPATGAWTTLPPGPLPGLVGPVGGWTGSEFLVFGNPNPDGPEGATSPGAAYNPATRTWRTLKPFPLGTLGDAGSYAVWTGSRLLVWGFFGNDSRNSERGTTDTRAALFDPVTNTWSLTSPAPLAAPIFGKAFWTGTELLVWGQVGTSGSSQGQAQLVSYTPDSGAWQVLPASPGSIAADGAAAWTGSELFVVGGSPGATLLPSAAAFNPATNSWRSVPEAPEAFTGSDRSYTDLWTGREVLILSAGDAQGRPLLFDPATNQWQFGTPSPTPGRTEGPVVWDGTAALVWGGGTSHVVPPSPGASRPDGGGTTCCTPVAQGYAYTPPAG